MLLVSPHLDDAALSCSARILKNEFSLILTCFAGVPNTERQLSEWEEVTGASSAVQRWEKRRSDDASVWTSISQDYDQLDYKEDQDFESIRKAMGSQICEASKEVEAVYLPAGIGGHVHHLFVRDLALSVLGAVPRIFLYGELPYSAFFGWPKDGYENLEVEKYWMNAFKELPENVSVERPRVLRLTDHEKSRKMEILAKYSTEFHAVTGGSLELHTNTDMFDFELEFEIKMRG